jgi:hypothetical protein
MRKTPEFSHLDARRVRRAAALRIAGVILIAAVLAGCDRCGDLAFPGTTACRQEAPKPQ